MPSLVPDETDTMDATTYSALGQPGVGFFMALIIGALPGGRAG
jgi:hypothetical protein